MELFESETRISDLIKRLREIQAEHGDLKVTHEYNRGGVAEFKVDQIRVKHLKLREKRDRVVNYTNRHEEMGEKVLSI